MNERVRDHSEGNERASSSIFMLKPYFILLSRMKRKTS